MHQIRVTMIALLSMTTIISACAPQIPITRPSDNGRERNDACAASFVNPAGNLKGSGIEIPLGKWAGGPIKIGTVQYDHSDAQKLSEAVQRAENSRLTFCRATSVDVLNLLPATDRKEVILQANHSYETVQLAFAKFVNVVEHANMPQQSVAAAAVLTQDAEAEKRKILAKAPAAEVPSATETGKQASAATYDPQSWSLTLALMQAESADRVRKLSDKIDVLSKRMDNRRPRGEIRVMGFGENGVALLADERQRLYSQFQDALDKVPESQRPVVLIVGYGNRSSAYLKNIDLGLRRAQTVLSFLQEQKFSRGYEGHVMSGGIQDSAFAERVDVFVTGA